jgi:Holliday junction resolvasome RuvABC endonuclease subunit
MSIDPGLTTTGYAIWKDKKTFITGDVIRPHKQNTSLEKIRFVHRELMKIYRGHMPNSIVIEIPEHWSGATGFAARESGSVFKLLHLVGYIQGAFEHNGLARVDLFSPREWKGQLSKEMVKKRLMNITPLKKINLDSFRHDLIDAIAIGYVYLGGKL